jgi:hypothetical protein
MAEGFASPSTGAGIPGTGDGGLRAGTCTETREFERDGAAMITPKLLQVLYVHTWPESEVNERAVGCQLSGGKADLLCSM